MIWDDLFEAMLKEVALELGFACSKAWHGYVLSKGNKVIGFTNFVGRNGKLKILMSPRLSGRPIDLGDYAMDELKGKKSKARTTLIAKLMEESK